MDYRNVLLTLECLRFTTYDSYIYIYIYIHKYIYIYL